MTRPANFLQKGLTFFKSLAKENQAVQHSMLQVTDLPSWQNLLEQGIKLPGQYALHFQPDALPDSTGLVGREADLTALEEMFQRWESGRACSLALVGPEGSGKTSLINGFVDSVARNCPVLIAQLPRRLTCVEDLLATFAEIFATGETFSNPRQVVEFIRSRPRQLFILEQGHQLTLRLVGCRAALEVLFQILIETRQHWMWVVSFRKFPWDRLVMTARIQEYFTHQHNTLYHDSGQVRKIIEGRHTQTGANLEFFAGENAIEGRQEDLANNYFADLFAATDGNIVAAFYYWLLSLDNAGPADMVRIKPLGAVGADYLRSLDRSYHFSLAEVVWHGGLSCYEHQQIFLLGEQASRLQLEFLVKLNLLVTDGVDGDGSPFRYRLNPVYYKQVVALLESTHLLY